MGRVSSRRAGLRRAPRLLEPLEMRLMLAAHLETPVAPVKAKAKGAHTNIIIQAFSPSATSPPGTALTPSQMRHAYGIDQVLFGAIAGDGTGQTIAIIDAYHYPTAAADLAAFDAQFGLPDLATYTGPGMTVPYFRQVAQDGTTNFPGTDSTGGWETEEALDIEWAHAIAPQANIMLVEATSPTNANLIQSAVNWARSQAGVAAISMSFSEGETFIESGYDTYFTTPAGHSGVSFFAATGDNGQPSGYPAFSPNVVAVGGTTLVVSGSNYGSEVGWSGSGGSVSVYENQPPYQNGVVTQSTTMRANPDVAMDADPNSGVAVYDSFMATSGPWLKVGGTSLATPMWAGLMAIIDQGRVLNGLAALDGRTQTLPMLYQLPGSDFHDILTGNNGFSAGPGYDLVTGRGTPVANVLIADMTLLPSAAPGTPVLSPASDTGFSSSDNITSLDNGSPAKELQFTVPSTIAGATVNLFADGNLIGSAVASGTTTNITTNGSFTLTYGSHAITATQTQPGMAQSPGSGALTLVIESSPPTVFSTSPNGTVTASQTSVQYTFSGPMDPSSFALPSGVQSFTGPFGNVPSAITGFAWSPNNTVLTVSFLSQSAAGPYQLVLAPLLRDAAGNTIAAPAPASFGIGGALYSANMNANPGWTFSPPAIVGGVSYQWQYGPPANQGHGPPTAFTGTNVIGFNLTGNGTYPASLPATQYAGFTINAAGATNLVLNFWYWLEIGTSAEALVQVSPDGVNWTTLYSSGIPPNGTFLVSTTWALDQFAIPAFANQSALQIRWGLGPSLSNANPRSGWTLDDVTVTGVPTASSSITGTVFQDNNSNSALDSGEPGIPGATVFLDLNHDGTLDPGDPTAVTNSSGIYSFPAVVAGAYTVREVLPPNTIATGSLADSLTANGPVTNQNFANFPTSFSASAANASYYLRLDPTGTYLQISSGSTPLATPTYQIALSALPSLNFNFTGAGDALYVDFSNGSPLAAGNLTVTGVALQNDQLFVLGQSPGQAFNMTDFQIGLQSGPHIAFQNLDVVQLADGTYYYTGTLSTLQQLYIDSQAMLVWI